MVRSASTGIELVKVPTWVEHRATRSPQGNPRFELQTLCHFSSKMSTIHAVGTASQENAIEDAPHYNIAGIQCHRKRQKQLRHRKYSIYITALSTIATAVHGVHFLRRNRSNLSLRIFDAITGDNHHDGSLSHRQRELTAPFLAPPLRSPPSRQQTPLRHRE